MKKVINNNIDKSLKIIKREREKIKEEKKKIKLEKDEKFYNTKFGKFLKDFFDISDDEKYISSAIRRRVFSNFMNMALGIILCLMILFVLSGGKNYLKLYYELRDLIEIYDTISSEYYGDLEDKELVETSINAMVSSVGDAYTTYANEKYADDFLGDLNGTYEGIGCMVSMDEKSNIVVIKVFENSPAEKAGIKNDDIILSIDGVDYVGKTSEDMATYVKNEAKDEISMKVKREDKELEFVLVRQKVEVPSVASEVIEQDDKKIGYISIDLFSSVAGDQFETQLKKLEKDKIEGLVIDVRNNSGGYLDVVTNISKLFLDKGKTIYQLETKEKKEKVKDDTKTNRKYPVVVLVNGGSASASEILAASIKESYGGFVIGTNTFGKGTVQKTKTLKNGSIIKYTVQKWLTPEGEYIDENGIAPTDIVEFEENGFRNDSQLDYSIKLIVEKIK